MEEVLMGDNRGGHESFSFSDGTRPIKRSVRMHPAISLLIESIRAAHWTLVLFMIAKFCGN
jgi:hypothetical protein